jgi:hypothetical protein
MVLKTLALAGGLLALVLAGVASLFKRSRSTRITTDQLSGDWLARARGKEEHHPW